MSTSLHIRPRRLWPAATLVLAAMACAGQTTDDTAESGEEATVPPTGGDEGSWQVLFDGSSTAAWRGYRADSLPGGWQVVDGALTRIAQAGDIVTTEEYRNFELELEWQIAEGGNSGIMFRVTEDLPETYHSGPEMQVLDDARHVDGQNPLTSSGSNYALHAPTRSVVKPAGEWNAARLLANANHVEHWLNGEKIVEYELGSPEWEALVSDSKFIEWPRYGREARGHIALQDHGDRVAYRNIRIRVLPD
jgi:hypothetical protein